MVGAGAQTVSLVRTCRTCGPVELRVELDVFVDDDEPAAAALEALALAPCRCLVRPRTSLLRFWAPLVLVLLGAEAATLYWLAYFATSRWWWLLVVALPVLVFAHARSLWRRQWLLEQLIRSTPARGC